MAISLQNILKFAEDSGQNPDGSPFKQRSGPNALTYPERGTPLIIKDMPLIDTEPNGTVGLINEVTNNFVRGGAITLGNAVIDDVKRLGKVLISPNGIAWGVAQIALSRTNPQNLISPRNRLTLPISTLATAGTGAAGIRFRKDGLIDLKTESGYNYDSTRGGPKYESSILELARDPLSSSDHNIMGIYDKTHIFEVNGDIIKEYGGGAHSIFGIGKTTIKRYKADPYRGHLRTFNIDSNILRRGPNATKLDAGTPGYTDYKTVKGLPHQVKRKGDPNKSTRIGLYKVGDPGRKPTATTPRDSGDSYRVYDSKTIDKISAANIFKRTSPDEPISSEFRDYIKFRIAVVDTENPLNDNVILFRALLDNVADNFSGDWNSYKYNGRAEKFYTYSGFDRAITFGFKIHTQTRWEQKPLWRKLNYLVAQTAPEYKNRRMRGVFSRLTIGDWMNEIPGFFTSVNLSWNTAYPWEIRYDDKGADANINEYPHILDVSCNFQPVHNFAPSNSPTTPFLLPEIGVLPNRKYAQQSDDELIINQFTTLAGNKFTDGVAKDAASAYYDNEEAIAEEEEQREEKRKADEAAAIEAQQAENALIEEEYQSTHGATNLHLTNPGLNLLEEGSQNLPTWP